MRKESSVWQDSEVMHMKNDTESREMYLKTILSIEKEYGFVRNVDIAKELGYSKASVSVAVKKLQEGGLVTVQPAGRIFLTDSGRVKAEKIFERNLLLIEFLQYLGAGPALAKENACSMEHVLSDELLEIIRQKVANQ